jgi:hypothetical protein
MKLLELSMKAGSLEKPLSDAFEELIKLKPEMVHVGDIQHTVGDSPFIKVLYHNQSSCYFLCTDATDVGFVQTITTNKNVTIQNVYIAKPFRRQGINPKFLFFLKKNEGYDKIIIGDVHSEDTYDALKAVGHRFDIKWEKDGEQKEFNVDTIDDFYDIKHPTGWKIVLENDGDFSDWSKFYNPIDVRAQYDWLINK